MPWLRRMMRWAWRSRSACWDSTFSPSLRRAWNSSITDSTRRRTTKGSTGLLMTSITPSW